MQVIKKNILAVICGAVALLSIVAIFWPLSQKYQEIEDQLKQSARTNQDIKTAQSQGLACRLPIVDPQKTEAPQLSGFPTQVAYQEGLKVVKKIQEQSEALMKQAIGDNKRAPIEPDALKYRSGAPAAKFKDSYYGYLEALKGKDGLNALPPPMPKDVADEYARCWKIWELKVPAVSGVRDEQKLRSLQEQFNKDVAPGLPGKVAKARAEACAMYLGTGGLYVHPGIPPQGTSTFASLNDVWAAQIGLWIQTDICNAIIQTNKTLSRPDGDRLTVANACIKRLVRTNINPSYITATGPVVFGSRSGTGDMGITSTLDPRTGLPPEPPAPQIPTVVRSFQPTFTGRVSNDVYEVVHFSFTVDIEAANCRALLANLTSGRFITVLSTNMTALDRGACQKAGLLYGNEPVVQLTVNAEAVFFSAWTKELMPEPVRLALQKQLHPRN